MKLPFPTVKESLPGSLNVKSGPAPPTRDDLLGSDAASKTDASWFRVVFNKLI